MDTTVEIRLQRDHDGMYVYITVACGIEVEVFRVKI